MHIEIFKLLNTIIFLVFTKERKIFKIDDNGQKKATISHIQSIT